MAEIYETDVERKKALEEFENYNKMSELEQRQFNKQKSSIQGLDFDAMQAGADRWEQARRDYNHKIQKIGQEIYETEAAERAAFMQKLSDSIEEDNRQKAEKEYQEELSNKEAELKDSINKKHNLKTPNEEALENDLRAMLSRMNSND